MKRIFLISLLVVLLMGTMFAAGNISISFTGNLLGPADKDYKDIYGSGIFLPELKLSFGFTNNLFVWGGLGILNANGTTPVLEEEAKSSQTILSLGAGYKGDFTPTIGYKIEAGAAYFSYSEESMGLKVNDNAIGFVLNLGITYKITPTFFAELLTGYLLGSDTLTVEGETTDVKLGGFKAGAGIGITF